MSIQSYLKLKSLYADNGKKNRRITAVKLAQDIQTNTGARISHYTVTNGLNRVRCGSFNHLQQKAEI